MNLNDQIKAYLQTNNIAWDNGDFLVVQPEGDAEHIETWNARLGAQPSAEQLAAMAPVLAKASLKARAASMRFLMETGGVTVTVGGESNVPVSTQRGNDREVLTATMAAFSAGLRSDTATFKFADGKSRVVSNADMRALIISAFVHVQAAFDTETQAVADIEAGTLTTTADIDARFV